MRKFLYVLPLVFSLIISCKKTSIQIHVKEIQTSSSYRLNKIAFFNSQIGFAVGGEQFSSPEILMSKDAGLSWQIQELPAQAEKKEIYGLAIDPLGRIITVGYGGTIYYSNDTGKQFNYRQHNSWKELKAVSFRDEDSSFIIGGVGFDNGHISAFKNDGTGSNQIQTTWNFELSDIHFCDDKIGYICGYGAILKTTDGGTTWNYTSAKNDFFKAMSWKNSNEGVVVAYEGSIIKTSDGGATWISIRNGNSITKQKMHFLDIDRNTQHKIIAVGEKGLVYSSNDDGNSWDKTENFTTKNLRGISFRDDENYFIVGDDAALFQVTN